ncbi:RCC1 domain-containing protein [Chengkuizengella sediminis]|uniref:RCC1 domain-containing protein n=1 Tax=Chengkuizengella sediminis TaxID=1885917 RepID=UPI0030B85437
MVTVGRSASFQIDVSKWTNVVQVSAGYYHTVGLKSNEVIIAVGDNLYGQTNVERWISN